MESEAKTQLEKALQDQHRTQILLDATIESTVSGVVVCDLDLNFVVVNPAARRMLGKVSDLGPDHWDETVGLFESEDGRLFERHELPLFRACRGESIDRMELLVRSGDDRDPIWLEANATQILGLNDEPLGAVTVFNDITLERKSREGLRDLHKQTESKLVDSNRQLDDVLNTIPDAIWRGVQTDGEFEFTYFSPGIEAITGSRPDVLTDGTERFDEKVHQEDRERVNLLLSEISLGQSEDTEVEYRLIHADGSTRWIVNRIRAVTTADSLVVQGIISDVTGHRETKQALSRAERLSSIGTLAAGIAHEINNPLAAIMLTSELAKTRFGMGGLSEVQFEEAFEDIKQQVERCAKIVKDVLMFANNETLEREVRSVCAIAHESKKLIQLEARKRKIEIEIHDSGEAKPVANVNATEICQVIVNLLANAIEASPDGSKIELVFRNEGDFLICSVIDFGSGMDPKARQSVFDPFYTSRRTEGGTGLGLSLCHSIISNHGGEIWVEESELGKGTTFSFSLPMALELD